MQELQRLYRAGAAPELVEVPPASFLMLDGHGDPNVSAPYQAAVQALYAVSYAIKFRLQRAGGPTYRVAPLEGLWWADDMASFADDKAAWHWTMMIRQPAELTPALVEEVAREVAERKRLPVARELRLERFAEGLAAQVLYLAPIGTRGRRSSGCTPSSRNGATQSAASTMRSTWAIPGAPLPSG